MVTKVAPDHSQHEDLPAIAVLEDDAGMRHYLQRVLGVEYRLIMVQDGRSLLAAIKSERVKLVLLDIRLPGENGTDVAARIREQSGVPIIFLSGMSAPECIAAGLAAGAEDYVTKPVDPLVLKARIAKALRHGKTLLRLYDGLARAQARLNEGRSQ